MDIETEPGADELLREKMIDCIEKCMLCHQVVVQTMDYCLQKGGEFVKVDAMRTMLDCAQITTVAADFLARNSELHIFTCRACAEACLSCALSCEDMGEETEVMQTCAEVCHLAAKSCQSLVAEAQ